ncbi:GntR family transcriptional regulator [Hoyosella subflava]|uniref:Transcriptional regulator protein n=1 Tax=Hoyosella subflava (strain DSM 45089 / JCM 17490 / NBRC 109087 / DQS3-9A1) TaxID=443218 RepID=F6EKY7_HOYSD|nr:GntR family transcriptional regulator [Hoyosella subflava]AEF41467.1 Transcriptional regulator protein [Hoyosella subflava DQS3-9A1]
MTGINAPTRIPRATYASLVGERIRSSIMDGRLRPGQQLNESELAASFGVSRGPVREALQRLIQEGLLRSEPHRGVFVPVLSSADVDDIYLARVALETAAVRRITETSRAELAYKVLDPIVRTMCDARDTGDRTEVADRDLDFHTTLVAAAGSPRLERMFTTVISETRLCVSVLTAAYGARDDLVDEHRTISEMIRDENAEGAVAVLTKHFVEARVTLKRQLEVDSDRVRAG